MVPTDELELEPNRKGRRQPWGRKMRHVAARVVHTGRVTTNPATAARRANFRPAPHVSVRVQRQIALIRARA